MDKITSTIGAFDVSTKTVPVTFALADVTFERPVNACLDSDGAYDPTATADRVDQVAAGVAQKIALGVIRNDPAPTVALSTMDETSAS